MSRPGPSKTPFVGYFQEMLKKKSFIDVKEERVCLLCSSKNTIMKGIFKQITLFLTKIICLTVNSEKTGLVP
jgi:hypothetical protein